MGVWYSNGPEFKWSGPDYIRLPRLHDYHSKTGLLCPDFKWHLKTGPFEDRTGYCKTLLEEKPVVHSKQKRDEIFITILSSFVITMKQSLNKFEQSNGLLI